MLLPIALRAINHVLKGEDWALKRLRAFSGQSLRLELGRFQVPVRIDDKGLLVAQSASASPAPVQPAVVITLPEDTPARLLLGPASLVGRFLNVKITGSTTWSLTGEPAAEKEG